MEHYIYERPQLALVVNAIMDLLYHKGVLKPLLSLKDPNFDVKFHETEDTFSVTIINSDLETILQLIVTRKGTYTGTLASGLKTSFEIIEYDLKYKPPLPEEVLKTFYLFNNTLLSTITSGDIEPYQQDSVSVKREDYEKLIQRL